MGKILIIKGADFSNVSVNKIEIVPGEQVEGYTDITENIILGYISPSKTIKTPQLTQDSSNIMCFCVATKDGYNLFDYNDDVIIKIPAGFGYRIAALSQNVYHPDTTEYISRQSNNYSGPILITSNDIKNLIDMTKTPYWSVNISKDINIVGELNNSNPNAIISLDYVKENGVKVFLK